MSVKPHDLVLAVGGKVLEELGYPYLQNGRLVQQSTYVFTRAGSTATPAYSQLGRSAWAPISSDTPRWGKVLLNGQVRTTLDLAPGSTNLLTDSNDFSNGGGSAWNNTANLTVSTAPSAFGGLTAYTHQNDNAGTFRFRSQTVGTFQSGWQCFSMVLENLDAAATNLQLFDDVNAGILARAEYNWQTGVASIVAGDAVTREASVEQLGYGPSGGQLVRLSVAAIPPSSYVGESRQVICYPSGTGQNGQAITFHQAQLVNGRGPGPIIVSTSTGSAALALEAFTVPSVAIPGGPLSLYQDVVVTEQPSTGPVPAASTSPTAVRFGLVGGWVSTAGSQVPLGGLYQNRTAFISVAASTLAQYTPGDRVEQLLTLSTAGQLALTVSVNGGKPHRTLSTSNLRPGPRTVQPDYTLSQNQRNLVTVLARGVHAFQRMRELFP